MNRIGYIYKITNPNGRVYIGQSFNLKDRVRKYKKHATESQPKLHASLVKYGWDAHQFEIIEEGFFSREEIDRLEQTHIKAFNACSKHQGMNVHSGGHATGFHSEETKLKMSDSARKRSSEWSTAISAANRVRVHGESTRAKMSKAKKGIPLKKEHADQVRKNIATTNWKLVFDTVTGIYFDNAKQAAEAYQLKHSTLKGRLNGSKINNTSLVYA